jgi:hypothetical protein
VTNYIEGVLVEPQNELTKEITMQLIRQSGSGTYSNWNVILVSVLTVVIAGTPVADADGGWGTTTKAAGRASWELIRRVQVNAAIFAEPGGPPADTFLIRKPASGANWAGHDNEWATWDGVSWSFEAPVNGDMSLETGSFAGRLWVYVGSLDEWIQVGHRNTVARLDALDIGSGYALTVSDFTKAFGVPTGGQSPFLYATVVNAAAVDQFLSLPDPLSFTPSSQPGDQITVMNRSGLQILVNVSGGSLIDGVLSVAIPDDSSAAFFRGLTEWTKMW